MESLEDFSFLNLLAIKAKFSQLKFLPRVVCDFVGCAVQNQYIFSIPTESEWSYFSLFLIAFHVHIDIFARAGVQVFQKK